MLSLSRLSVLALASVSLSSCGAADSAAKLLMSPLSMGMRTLSTVGRSLGASATKKEDDTTSKAIAERGRQIEQREEVRTFGAAASTVVAQH